MKFSERSIRTGGVVQEAIPPILQKLFTPDEVGFLTVTAVEVSGDLGVIDVYLRSINGPRSTFAKLRRAEKKVASELVKKVPMRRVPIIRFKSDNAIHHVEKMEKIDDLTFDIKKVKADLKKSEFERKAERLDRD